MFSWFWISLNYIPENKKAVFFILMMINHNKTVFLRYDLQLTNRSFSPILPSTRGSILLREYNSLFLVWKQWNHLGIKSLFSIFFKKSYFLLPKHSVFNCLLSLRVYFFISASACVSSWRSLTIVMFRKDASLIAVLLTINRPLHWSGIWIWKIMLTYKYSN